MKRHLQIGILTALMWTLFPLALQATPVGKVTAIEGKVDLTAAGKEAKPVTPGDAVNVGDFIRTKSKSKCEVTFIDGNILRLAESTRIQVSEYMIENDKRQETIGLLRGKIRSIVQKGLHALGTERGGHYEVRTPTAVLGVRGSDVINFHLNGISGGVLIAGNGYGYPIANPQYIQNYSQGQGLTIIAPNLPPILRSVNLQQLNQHIYDTNLGSGSGATTAASTTTATTTATTVGPSNRTWTGTPYIGGLPPTANVLTPTAMERITSIAPMTTVLPITTIMTTTVRPTTTTVPTTTTSSSSSTTTTVRTTTTTSSSSSTTTTVRTTTTTSSSSSTSSTSSSSSTTSTSSSSSTTSTSSSSSTTSTSSSSSTTTTVGPSGPSGPSGPDYTNGARERMSIGSGGTDYGFKQISGKAGYAKGPFMRSNSQNRGTYSSHLNGTIWSSEYVVEAGSGNLFHKLNLHPGWASPPSAPAGLPGESRIGAMPVAGAWVNINDSLTGVSGGQLSYRYHETGRQTVAAGNWIETNRFINMLSTAPRVLDMLNIPRNYMGFVPLSGSDNPITPTVTVGMTAYFYGYSSGPPRIWVASPVTGSTTLANPLTGTPIKLGGPGFANNIDFTFTNWNTSVHKWAATVNTTSTGQINPPSGPWTQMRGYSAGSIGATRGTPPLTTFSGTAAGIAVP